MIIIPKIVMSITENILELGSQSIDTSRDNIYSKYELLEEWNAETSKEMVGETKQNFDNACKEITYQIEQVYGSMSDLSTELLDYVTGTAAINEDAEIRAGGNKGE